MLGRCVYCGGFTFGRLACCAHFDLLALDPFYAPELRQPTTGLTRLRPPLPPRRLAA